MFKLIIHHCKHQIIYIRLQGTASVLNPQAYLQIFGVKGLVNHIDSSVFDQPYLHQNDQLVSQKDINMDGNKITGL